MRSQARDFVEVSYRGFGDTEAPLVLANDEALARQTQQRLAYRAQAHTVSRAQLFQTQPRVGHQTAGKNAVAQLRGQRARDTYLGGGHVGSLVQGMG